MIFFLSAIRLPLKIALTATALALLCGFVTAWLIVFKVPGKQLDRRSFL